MGKKNEWSWTNLQEVRRNFSHPELQNKFHQLLQLYFDKQPILLKLYKNDPRFRISYGVRYPSFIQTAFLFGDWYANGIYVFNDHKKSKSIDLKEFLTYKFDKDELYQGIKSLIDYEHFINVVEQRGGPFEVAEIDNATIRREALVFYGVAKFFKDMNAKLIHQQGKNELLLLQWRNDEPPLMMVKVIDSTTKDVYLLRVPPEMKTVKEAVAWTFNLDPDEYNPLKET